MEVYTTSMHRSTRSGPMIGRSVDEERHACCLANVRESQAPYICALVYSVARMSETLYCFSRLAVVTVYTGFLHFLRNLGLPSHSRVLTSTDLYTCPSRLVCSSRHFRPSVSRCGGRLISSSARRITLRLASRWLALSWFSLEKETG